MAADSASQQHAMPVVGFLRHSSSAGSVELLVALRLGLDDAGFVEGKNLTIEYRWSEGVRRFRRYRGKSTYIEPVSCDFEPSL